MFLFRKRCFCKTLFGFLTSLCGCMPSSGIPLPRMPNRISPQSFATDPAVTRLAVAVQKGDEAEIAAAIEAGASANAVGSDGYPILLWSITRKSPAGFEALLDHGADINAPFCDPKRVPENANSFTVLEVALAQEDASYVKAALRHGVDPNFVPYPEDGRSLLFYGEANKLLTVIDALLDAGANINHRSRSGETAIVDAGMRCNYDIARHLLDRGADPTVKDHIGYDFTYILKEYGSRGVRPSDEEHFEAIVVELVRRGLLTRQDIVEANKPKPSIFDDAPPGVTVIEHDPASEAGRATLELNQAERDANARDQR